LVFLNKLDDIDDEMVELIDDLDDDDFRRDKACLMVRDPNTNITPKNIHL